MTQRVKPGELFRAVCKYPRLFVFLLLPPLAVADSPLFSVHDTNGDGYLDRSEYAVFLSRLWEKRGRRSGHHRPLPPPMAFEAIDRDGDGRIAEEELLQSLEKRLRRQRWRRGWGHEQPLSGGGSFPGAGH